MFTRWSIPERAGRHYALIAWEPCFAYAYVWHCLGDRNRLAKGWLRYRRNICRFTWSSEILLSDYSQQLRLLLQ